MAWSLYVEVRHDDAFIISGENDEAEEVETQEFFEATPIFIYRNPYYDCTEIEVDFDPSNHDLLHIVFVEYSVIDEEQDLLPRWDIASVCDSRRSAKSIAEGIEAGSIEGPWSVVNSVIESVEVYSLPVED